MVSYPDHLDGVWMSFKTCRKLITNHGHMASSKKENMPNKDLNRVAGLVRCNNVHKLLNWFTLLDKKDGVVVFPF